MYENMGPIMRKTLDSEFKFVNIDPASFKPEDYLPFDEKTVAESRKCIEKGECYSVEQLLEQNLWEADVVAWESCDERWLSHLQLDYVNLEEK